MKFMNNLKHEHIIDDGMKRKSFCTNKCLYAYVRDASEMVRCCMCRYAMRFYQSVRRCYDDRCFCSFGCIKAAEQNIEQVLQNDEQFHLDISILRCKTMDDDSDMDSNGSFQGIYFNFKIQNSQTILKIRRGADRKPLLLIENWVFL